MCLPVVVPGGGYSGKRRLVLKPELGLVFINYHSARWLQYALESLAASEPELSREVVIVDNGSASRTEELMLRTLGAQFGARVLFLKRNVGYGAAANRGIIYTQADFVAVCNPDIRFTDGSLSRLVGLLNSCPDAGVVSPQLFYPDGTPQPSCRRLPRLRYVLSGRRSPLVRIFPGLGPAREFLYLDLWQKEEPVPVEAVIGTVMVFRRQAFTKVGGFDEGYFMFAEDLDICYRLRKDGWQVFLEPRAKVIHYYGAVRRRWRRKTEYQRVRGLHRFFTRRRGFFSRLLLTPAFAGYYFMIEALGLVGLGEFEYSWQGMGSEKV
ncbi:MAG: glycosyltransferase family 2 protein [candidate division WOR-3 bacterium]